MRRKDPKDRVEKISIGLRKRTIETLDQVCIKEDVSRSRFIQKILERHFQPQQEARTSEIPFKMG